MALKNLGHETNLVEKMIWNKRFLFQQKSCWRPQNIGSKNFGQSRINCWFVKMSPGCEYLRSMAKQVDCQLVWKMLINFGKKEVTHNMQDKCHVGWDRKWWSKDPSIYLSIQCNKCWSCWVHLRRAFKPIPYLTDIDKYCVFCLANMLLSYLTFYIPGLPNFWWKKDLKFFGGTHPLGPLKI